MYCYCTGYKLWSGSSRGLLNERRENQMWRGQKEERNAGEREIVVGEERRTNGVLCL